MNNSGMLIPKKYWFLHTRYKRLFMYLILILVFAKFAPVVANNPRFCASCHEMRPNYYTLQASSHSQFTCLNCHWKWDRPEIKTVKEIIQPDKLAEIFKPLMDVERVLLRHFTRNDRIPIISMNPPQDKVCLKCHTLHRSVTPTGDLIIPHPRHESKKVTCVTCHEVTVHGKVASGDYTQIDFTGWIDITSVQKTVLGPELSPPMSVCMTCHKRRRVTLACEACHTQTKMPENHTQENFLQIHGKEARKNLAACDECHQFSIDSVRKRSEMTDPVMYASDNPFCRECHAKIPPSHLSGDWKATHGRNRDTSSCLTCHPANPGEVSGSATTNCSQCHGISHRAGWIQQHPVEIGSGVQGQCFSCHSKGTCSQCHQIP